MGALLGHVLTAFRPVRRYVAGLISRPGRAAAGSFALNPGRSRPTVAVPEADIRPAGGVKVYIFAQPANRLPDAVLPP